MNCDYPTFLSNLFDFWFNNEVPEYGKHLIFAFTTFVVALIIVVLNSSISVIQEKRFNPRMLIKYKDDVIKTIDDITEMEKFIQNLQK